MIITFIVITGDEGRCFASVDVAIDLSGDFGAAVFIFICGAVIYDMVVGGYIDGIFVDFINNAGTAALYDLGAGYAAHAAGEKTAAYRLRFHEFGINGHAGKQAFTDGGRIIRRQIQVLPDNSASVRSVSVSSI